MKILNVTLLSIKIWLARKLRVLFDIRLGTSSLICDKVQGTLGSSFEKKGSTLDPYTKFYSNEIMNTGGTWYTDDIK